MSTGRWVVSVCPCLKRDQSSHQDQVSHGKRGDPLEEQKHKRGLEEASLRLYLHS